MLLQLFHSIKIQLTYVVDVIVDGDPAVVSLIVLGKLVLGNVAHLVRSFSKGD